MRVLGVDLGMKRTGVAVSDALGLTARGVEVFSPQSRASDVERLIQHATDLEVEHIVIGLPLLPQSGEDTPWTKRVRGFAAALDEALEPVRQEVQRPLSVTLLDEGRTSIEGARRLVQAGVKKSKRKAHLDAAAAAVLVEDFIAQVKSGAVVVERMAARPSGDNAEPTPS